MVYRLWIKRLLKRSSKKLTLTARPQGAIWWDLKLKGSTRFKEKSKLDEGTSRCFFGPFTGVIKEMDLKDLKDQ